MIRVVTDDLNCSSNCNIIMHTHAHAHIKMDVHTRRHAYRQKTMIPWRKAQLKNSFVVISLGLLFPKLIIQEIFMSLTLSFHLRKSL